MSSDTSSTKPSQPQTVRFASVNQEIEPSHSIQSLTTLPSNISISNPEFSPEAQEEIRKLSRSLQSSPLQQRRMNHFAFEPVSLPTSRVSKPLYELAFETFFPNQALRVTTWRCLYRTYVSLSNLLPYNPEHPRLCLCQNFSKILPALHVLH